MVPVPAGFMAQVTAVFVDPVTVAVNCRCCAATRVAVAGVIVTATGGLRVTVAPAFFVASLTLVAIIVTVWDAVTDAGATYRPVLLIDPKGGLADQVTAVLPKPVTVAVNCCV